jgi:DNA-binding MurR/RpiR family transcriptional regulator
MKKNRSGASSTASSDPQEKAGCLNATPSRYEEIVNMISADYSRLSAGFQKIARFFTQNPNVIALESISAIARQCGVHPSSLVRFAQSFGFSGFKPLQAVFQTRLSTAAPGFRDRIHALENELSQNTDSGNIGYLKAIVVRDMAALQHLLDNTLEDQLSMAAKLLAEADTIYVAGHLGAEPVGVLLRYLMTMLKRRVVLLDPADGLATEMARTMRQSDILVAISFRHYAKEVVMIVDNATEASVNVIAITDSQLSPIAKGAKVLFTIPEEEYSFSRSRAAPMCLVQALAVATAAMLQPTRTDAPRIPTVSEIEQTRSKRKA